MSYHLGQTDTTDADIAKGAADITKGVATGAGSAFLDFLRQTGQMLPGARQPPPVVTQQKSDMGQYVIPGLLVAGIGTAAVIVAMKKKK